MWYNCSMLQQYLMVLALFTFLILSIKCQYITVVIVYINPHSNLDPNVADSLLGKLHVPSEAVLSYDSFKSIITTILNLQGTVQCLVCD